MFAMTLVWVLVGAAILVTTAAVVSGPPAARGAATGAALVVIFFGFGALVLQVIARVMPALALLVALLTYTLQVLGIGLAFVLLRRSGMLGDVLDPTWLSASMLALTVVWLIGHVRAASTARIPAFDPVSEPSSEQGPSAS